MKKSAVSFAVLLVFAGWASWPTVASADNGSAAPGGSYLQSCTNIGFSNVSRILTADCKRATHGGKFYSGVHSALATTACHPGSIANDDGVLECTAAMRKADGKAIPDGSYRQSCRAKSVSDNTLHAICDDGGGSQRPSRLQLHQCDPSGDIANHYGQLICAPLP